jgi:hypothetical protein
MGSHGFTVWLTQPRGSYRKHKVPLSVVRLINLNDMKERAGETD